MIVTSIIARQLGGTLHSPTWLIQCRTVGVKDRVSVSVIK